MYISGWWYTYLSEKYEFIKWEFIIPNIWNNENHVPNHQPDIIKIKLFGGIAAQPIFRQSQNAWFM